MRSPLPLRPVARDQLGDLFTVLTHAFGEDWHPDDLELELLTAEADRSLAAFDADRIVATAGIYTLDLAVPGARLPAAGVTWVGVAPTHRRRGLLTALMQRQFDDIHERGEPVAVLWASEASIYGRFGYGLASRRISVELERRAAALRADLPGADLTVELVEIEKALPAVAGVDDAAADDRPGQFRRDERWLRLLLADPERRRGTFGSLQCVTVGDGQRVRGYALYRTKNTSERPYGIPDGELSVVAQRTLDPAAGVALVRYLLSVDLMRRVRWWNLPVDDALPHLLTDPRQARTTVVDSLFARVVDVPAALSGRRYAAPVDTVIEVGDDRCPWNAGRWRLVGDRDGAEVRPTRDGPDLALDVEALGAAYLGGTPLSALAAAGRVRQHTDNAVGRVSAAFGWDPQPWCPTVF